MKLEGTQANRSAVGARIKLTVAGPSGEQTIFRTVGSGGSFGASSLQQEIGIGAADRILKLEIVWPDHTSSVEESHHLQPNSAYRIRQGEAAHPMRIERPLLTKQ